MRWQFWLSCLIESINFTLRLNLISKTLLMAVTRVFVEGLAVRVTKLSMSMSSSPQLRSLIRLVLADPVHESSKAHFPQSLWLWFWAGLCKMYQQLIAYCLGTCCGTPSCRVLDLSFCSSIKTQILKMTVWGLRLGSSCHAVNDDLYLISLLFKSQFAACASS